LENRLEFISSLITDLKKMREDEEDRRESTASSRKTTMRNSSMRESSMRSTSQKSLDNNDKERSVSFVEKDDEDIMKLEDLE